MAYTDIENGLLTTIRTHADFSSTNTSRGDQRILGAGLARAVVLTYGSLDEQELTLRRVRRTWSINVDLYVPWTTEINQLQLDLATERQKVIDTVAQWPHLSGTTGVIFANVRSAGAPDEITERRGSYAMHRLTCEVLETLDPSRQE